MSEEEAVQTLELIVNMKINNGFAYGQKNALCLQENIKTLLQSREKDKAELEKKDKIIDEMAKSIVHNNEIDYEICDNVHEQGAECDGYARETNKSCEQCIKQYFERIAEEN